MRYSIFKFLLLIIYFINLNVLAAEKIGDQKTIMVNGQSFTVTKYINENGSIRSEIINNATKRRINENELPKIKRKIIDTELDAKLN